MVTVTTALALLAACGHADDSTRDRSAPARTPGAVASSRAPAPSGTPAAGGHTPRAARDLPSARTSPSSGCPLPASGLNCALQRRAVAADAYARTRPGTVGIVLRDRRTGAVWRNAYANRLVWTASTIKLAMTVDLLLRDRAGTISLTVSDRVAIGRMLHVSDDDAADTLWFKYGRADYAGRFPSYGLTSVTFVSGFQRYWGYMKCTPNDLDRLMSYVLTELPADLRAYIVGQLRTVGENQQWGVWGAGPTARPGNKDGWSEEQGGWVINSVGFAGPDERYTLAMMNSLNGEGGYDAGTATITKVAATIFAGYF